MEFRPIISTLLRNKIAPFLVAVQIAISLAILTNALYIIQLRLDTASRPSGIKDEHSTFSLRIAGNRQLSPQEKLDQDAQFYRVIAAVPGVVGVADVNEMPMSQSGTYTAISLDLTQTKSTAETTIYSSAHSVIKAFGLNLIAGRDFNEADVESDDPNALTPEPVHSIITEALARQLYPDARDMSNVIGKRFFWGVGSDSTPTQIVGVVEHLQTPNANAREKGEYSTLVSRRRITSSPVYAVQTEPGQRDRVMAEVESALRQSDSLPINIKSRSTDEDRKIRYGREMTMAWMLIFVSVLLVIITSSGIVGMTSLWVSQRKKQIGVRRALGARKIDILRYFITENLIISCAGVVSGALMAVGLNQFLVSQLELTKMPPHYILLGALAFILLGLAAAYAPSWRAAGISPAVATRST